jgi:o-succinylbenzoate synthase
VRVAALEAIPVGLPFSRPYVTATGRLDRREMLIVRIAAADGTVGWGDAVPMSLRGGPGLDAVRDDLERRCLPALTSAAIGSNAEAISRCRSAGAGAQALSAIDIALLDLRGRLEDSPAWRLLGATAAAAVPCNATLGADDPGTAAGAAAAAVRSGFGTIKVKVGDAEDVERIRAVRAAAGPAMRLRIDANGAWSVDEAVDRLATIEPLGIELAEQPCADGAGLGAVREATGIPVVADESVTDLDDAGGGYARGCFDAATLKLAKVGGPHAAVAIAAAVPAYLSSALDSAIGIAAAVHTIQAMERRDFAAGLAHGLATSPLFADNVADDGALSGPEIAVADRPGLGIEVDESAIGRLRLR